MSRIVLAAIGSLGDLYPHLAMAEQFLSQGEAPILFTLGSAAVITPGSFYAESVQAIALLTQSRPRRHRHHCPSLMGRNPDADYALQPRPAR